MNYFVFKTNIESEEKAQRVNFTFKIHPAIDDWSYDLQDRDHVLRVKIKQGLRERDIIGAVNTCGFFCEALPD